ncbi:MAG: hypothetical protein NVSMB13_21500 [Mycobacteriales bacterium]
MPEGRVPRARLAQTGATASRRGFLGALGTVAVTPLLAGCGPKRRTPESAPAPRPEPDAGPVEAARADEQMLLALYDATLAAYPVLAGQLTPLREHHQRHLQALPPPRPLPSAVAPAASPTPAPAVGRPDPAAAIRVLIDAENAAATRRATDCLAVARPLAGLLASLAASEASHAVALGRR